MRTRSCDGPTGSVDQETTTGRAPVPAVRRRATPGRRAVGCLLAAIVLTPLSADGQEPEPPVALQRLERLAGSWEADRVEFLDGAGEVTRVSRASAHNQLQMNGRVMWHRGRLEEPAIQTRAWYYWDPADERLHMGSVSSGGRYDEFVGGWEADRLVLVSVPDPVHDGRRFRLTQSEISDTSFLETLEVSSDGGATWRVSSRQRMRRSGGAVEGSGSDGAGRRETREALDAMDAYIGRWRTGDRTDAEGRTFRYDYELTWIDAERSIAKMLLTRHAAAGSRVVFRGFKGRERDGVGVYYIATSPSGRGARGEVALEGENLVTRYVGWSAEGEVVEIRDVATPVVDDAFVTRTYLRADPEEEWRPIGEDRWTRVVPRTSETAEDPPARPAPPDTLVVRPGGPAVQARGIRDYGVVWVQYFETDGRRTLRRTIVDRVEREPGPDRELLVRRQTFLDLDGAPTSERVNRVDGVTLTPVRERWTFGERVTHVDYEGARVSGATLDGTPGEAALVFDERLEERGFDFNTMPLILAALPLEPGMEIRLPQVRISPPAFPIPEIDRVTIRVTGPERVETGPLGPVEAWRAVDLEHHMVFWLISEPPYLVRVTFPIDASTRSVMELGAVRVGGDAG